MKFKPLVAVDDLTWKIFQSSLEHSRCFRELKPRRPTKGFIRIEASAHLVGYVGTKAAEDLRRVGNIVGIVGRNRVEREYEESCAASRSSPC